MFWNDPVLRQIAMSAMILFGVGRLFYRFRKQKKGALPSGERLNMDWVRAQARRGNRIQAMRGYRELTGASLREAREKVEELADAQ